MAATLKRKSSKRLGNLVDNLSETLIEKHPRVSEPFVVENVIPQVARAHVVVIWDRWIGLSAQERSQVILDAYEKANRLTGISIMAATGLTAEESLRQDFLPYSIITMPQKDEKLSSKELEAAMSKAGGILVKVGESVGLRFPTRETAEAAYRKLREEIPDHIWTLAYHDTTT
ncbi:MAG TPA: hypothetical protein VL992_15755 [Tepidisphaeraceae bacterium]|nr:hypothetical protein [Tepidisphaeraceae bacterium]